MLLFVVVVILVFGGSGLYIGFRVVEPLELAATWRALTWLFVLSPATLPLWVILDRLGAGRWSDIATGVTYIALGTGSFLFVFTLIRDLGWLTVRIVHGLLSIPAQLPDASSLMRTSSGVIVGLAVVCALVAVFKAMSFPAVRAIDVPFRNLHPDLNGFRIVQLSDLHLGVFRGAGFVESVVEEVNSLAPDLVVITGDLSDGSVKKLGDGVLPLKDLRAPALFVTGNHEYYWSLEDWLRHLKKIGVRILEDSHHVIQRGDALLMVVGVSDPTARSVAPEKPSGLEVAAPNPLEADLKILLAHRTATAYQAAEFGFDLQLSGHTHGGQFFPWNYVIHWVQPFAVGLHRHRDLWVYCSRGTGFWGPPMRLGAPSEITELRLVNFSSTVKSD